MASDNKGYPPQYGGAPPYPPAAGYPQQSGYPPQHGYPQQAGYPPQPDYGHGSYGRDSPPGYNAPGYNHSPAVTPPVVMRTPYQQEEEDGADTEGSPFNTTTFSDKAIRRAFIRKVYLVLMTQLLVTVAFIALFIFIKNLKGWVQSNAWFYYVSYGTFLCTYIALVCCPTVRRKTPGNFICLAIFTLAFSYMTATISSFYDTYSVLIAVGITSAVCLAVTIFAIQTKVDFTMCWGLLFVLSMVLMFFGLACMIVYLTIGYNYILQCVYAGVAALILCLFLVFDTQMIMGGRKYELSPEEYIFGALQLYLDIVQLFLMILTLVGGGKSSS